MARYPKKENKTSPSELFGDAEVSERPLPKKRGRKKKDQIIDFSSSSHPKKPPQNSSSPSHSKMVPKVKPSLDTPSLNVQPVKRQNLERSKGKAHLPFKNAYEWVEVIQKRFNSKDRNIIATITPEPHGTYDLTIHFGSFFSLEEATQIANLQILVATDEHGHVRHLEDFDFDTFYKTFGEPKIVGYNVDIPDNVEDFYPDDEDDSDDND